MTKNQKYRMFAAPLLATIVVFAAIPAHAQFSVLYNLGSHSGDPLTPSGSLVQGRDGALYGTSYFGGTTGSSGTVFKISPDGRMTVIYAFCSLTNCPDGDAPVGGVTLRPDGHFIGTASKGGSTGNGTIFDLTQSGNFTVLYNFTGGTDGGDPLAPPILGPDGSFYGTTATGGGSSGCGTIYKITNSGATLGGFKLLHDFDLTDGCNAQAGLVLGADGNLYGVTSGGGTASFGVAFQVTPAGKFTVLHNFAGGDEGIGPGNPLIQGNDGNFYGTTTAAFAKYWGDVYQLTPAGGYTILRTLNGTTDGAEPLGPVQASDGNLYGATGFAGSLINSHCGSGCGTIFQVTPGGSYSIVHNFNGTAGGNPPYGPSQHTNGVIYGVALGGPGKSGLCGISNCGVVYSWSANLPAFVSLVADRGSIGSVVGILAQGFTSATTVSFNGTPATATVVSGTYLHTTVPLGATTGPVTVTTSTGTLTSNKSFVVTP